VPEFEAPESGAAELIDAHHHLWDTRVLDYPEFAGDPDLERPYLAGDYDAAAGACGVTGSIVVEAATAGAPGDDETRWLRREAACSRAVAGVVAWAPLGEPGLAGYLRDLLAAPGPPVVGIRYGLADSPALMAEPDLRAGVQAVGAAGLPFDLLVNADGLAAAAGLVQSCPDTRFVLNHLGNPPAGPGLDDWRADLARLAACDRVSGKLSGVAAEHAGRPATAANLRFAVEVFGPDRLMFGSDWPVSTLGGSRGLAAWVEAVTGALGSLRHSELTRILAGTARAVYGLTEPSPAWPAGSTQGRV